MKKYKKLTYLFLILVIVILAVLLYVNVSKGNSKDSKEKSFSQVEFLESKLVTLFNKMNHIEIRNYNVSVSEISKQAKEQKDQTSSNSSQSNSGEGSGEGSSSGGSSQSSGGESSTTSEDNATNESNQSDQKFSLKSAGILSNSEQVNWEEVKNEIEILYASIPTITLDLYQIGVAQEDILGFNKQFDELTIVAKEEKKEETLNRLSQLYEYIPKFTNKATDDEMYKVIAEAKLNLLKAYAKLDTKKWDEITNDTKQMIDTYSKLVTNTNLDNKKQYSISKIYIMLNELQNAVNVQDETVFLIKYKNILEEMNNL